MGIDFSSIEGFEWDSGNKNKNVLKHNVSCQEAEEVFQHEPVFFEDTKHSLNEQRYGVFGITKKARLLTVIFTIRNNKVRVISARDQNRKERNTFYKNKHTHLS